MEFKIIAPGASELVIVPELPSAFKTSNPIFQSLIAGQSDFGNLVFRNFKGMGFEIWYSNYKINHDTEVLGKADIMALELHIQFQNHFEIQWDGLGMQQLSPYKFNLSHTPFVNILAKFQGGKEYYTFDVHFSKEYLRRLSGDFLQLGRFLDKIEQGIPASLSAIDHLLTPTMITVVKDILNCSFKEDTAKLYIEGKVMELLIHALERLSGSDGRVPIKLTAYDIERLHEAKEIVLEDFENKISLKELSRKVCINEYKLKKGFKYLFGTSVMDYRVKAKMETARNLLLETDKAIDDIGYEMGYDFVSNFNSAFKKHFDYTPGYLRKK